MIPQPGKVTIQPMFLDGSAGRIFATCYEPRGEVRSNVLFCPPFAEEMNKSRRMFSLTAQALAREGVRAMIVDLFGTGESEGDFGDASWDLWSSDLSMAVDWLLQQGPATISLVGLRLGAQMAVELAARLSVVPLQLVIWQPVTSGRGHMTQFLRLKMAAQLAAPTGGPGTKELRKAAARGELIEIAGYCLAPRLLTELDARDLLEIDPPTACPVSWMEVVSQARPDITLMSGKVVDAWQAGGVDLHLTTAIGEPFWATAEIALVREFIDTTVECLG